MFVRLFSTRKRIIPASHSCIVDSFVIVEISTNDRALLYKDKNFGERVFVNVKLRRTGSNVRINIFY